ncbi:MAG: GNAT family N-acetyltransferase [Geodermatophilaceae bacterium]|nr:GNAT family N-acetyltransferase [Geodermatophilaceae bacterium]
MPEAPSTDVAHLLPLVTGRLVVRPLASRDLDALLAYRGDALVCRYLPFVPQSRELLLDRVAGSWTATAFALDGDMLILGVARPTDDQVVGDMMLRLVSREHRCAELGYVFSPSVSGQGYATEASAAILGLAFDALDLHRVVARLDARNLPSARLAVRLGMRQEAHLVRNEFFKGEWSDELDFAMLAEEWPTSAAHEHHTGTQAPMR